MSIFLYDFFTRNKKSIVVAFFFAALLSLLSGTGYMHAEGGDLTKMAMMEMGMQYLSSLVTLLLVSVVLSRVSGVYGKLGRFKSALCFFKGGISLVFLFLILAFFLSLGITPSDIEATRARPELSPVILIVVIGMMSLLFAVMAFATQRHMANAELRKVHKRQARKHAGFTFFIKIPWLALRDAVLSPLTLTLAASSLVLDASSSYAYSQQLYPIGALADGVSTVLFAALFYTVYRQGALRDKS
jgi:hypothetical protein